MNYRLLGWGLLAASMAGCSSPSDSGAGAAATPAGEVAQAKRAAGTDSTDPLHIFRAFGNEPFWSVRVEGDTLTFITPDDQVGQVMQGQRYALEDGMQISGEANGQSFSLVVKGGMCSDGMSDIDHEMESSFQLGDTTYKGCGEIAK